MKALGSRNIPTFEPLLFALSCWCYWQECGGTLKDVRGGMRQHLSPAALGGVGEWRGLSLGLHLGWKGQILDRFQVRSHSSSFPMPAGALQSTSAGHLPSQPGNPGALTSSFLSRHTDKAPSRDGAGAGTLWSAPNQQHGDRGHDRCVHSRAVRPGHRLLLFP